MSIAKLNIIKTLLARLNVSADGAVSVDPLALAMERGLLTTNKYGVGVPEGNGVILDETTTEQAVSNGEPALLFSVYIPSALTGNLTITGLLNVSGVAADLVLPVGTVGRIAFDGDKINDALIMTKSVGTDVVKVSWRPQT